MAASKPGGTLSIGKGEHRKIWRSPATRDALRDLAAQVAAEANNRAGISDGYVSESEVAPNPDVTVSGDTARAHVWAKTGDAIRAERRNAILMGLAADGGRP